MSKQFDEWVSTNKDKKLSVTKLKNLTNPENHNSEIPMGAPFVGQVSLRSVENDPDYGSGFLILVDGGCTMHTSLVREVVQKSATKWLAKTLNSVYRIEVVA